MVRGRGPELGRMMSASATALGQQMIALHRAPHLNHLDDEALQESLRAWRDLSVQSEELTEASTMICQELARQTTQVDRIEDHMALAADNTLEGASEVVAADKNKAAKWRWQAGSVGALTGGAVGILGGPVGVGIGVFVGTSIGTFIGSIPKKMVDRDCERSSKAIEAERDSRGGGTAEAAEPLVTDVSSSFAEREEMQARAAEAAAASRRSLRGGRQLYRDDDDEAGAAEPGEDPAVRALKLRCLENVLEAMQVTSRASELLASDRDALDRICRDDGTIAVGQGIAGNHVAGMEEGWLTAFFRRLRPIPGKPGLFSRIRSLIVSTQAADDSDSSPAPPEEGEDVAEQIHRILCELKEGQTAMRTELTQQVDILEHLEENVDRRQRKADSLVDRMEKL